MGRKEGAGVGTIAGGYLPILGVAPHTGEAPGVGNVGITGCAGAEGDGDCFDGTSKTASFPSLFSPSGDWGHEGGGAGGCSAFV